MLINCQECGKEISDKAPACIYCGCPISDNIVDNSICNINGINYDLSRLIDKNEKMKQDGTNDATRQAVVSTLLKDIVNDRSNNYVELARTIAYTGKIPPTFTPKPKEEPKITCPRCGSTQITTGPRGVSGFWGFIGASKTVNRCASCGKTWEP